MKVLFIGGTGNISTASSKLVVKKGMDLYLLNRGNSNANISGATTIVGDINKPEELLELQKHKWDVVVNWIAFTPADIERDITLFLATKPHFVIQLLQNLLHFLIVLGIILIIKYDAKTVYKKHIEKRVFLLL